MNQRTMLALNELASALYDEAGDGDMVLTLPVKTYNTVVPQPHDTSGMTEFIVYVAGGKITFRMKGHDR